MVMSSIRAIISHNCCSCCSAIFTNCLCSQTEKWREHNQCFLKWIEPHAVPCAIIFVFNFSDRWLMTCCCLKWSMKSQQQWWGEQHRLRLSCSRRALCCVFLSLSLVTVSCTAGFTDYHCTVISSGLALFHIQPIKSLIQQAPPVLLYHNLCISAERKG